MRIRFNIYSEWIKWVMEGLEDGIKIAKRTINNFLYADDIVIIASSEEKLSHLFRKLNTDSKEAGLLTKQR